MFSLGIIKIEQGQALVRSHVFTGKVDVSFTGGVIFPILHKAEIIDISVKTLVIDRSGSEGLICRDNVQANVRATFCIQINHTSEDIIKVAQAIGCDRASNPETLEALFGAKFSEALERTARQFDFVDIDTRRDDFRDEVFSLIGTDLNGYSLEDCAITQVRRAAGSGENSN